MMLRLRLRLRLRVRHRAVGLARRRDRPVAQIAADLAISESCLRRPVGQLDVEEGRKEGLSCAEREELVRLRNELRVARMEVKILKRASAFFARENVFPKD
jgi:transposase